MKVVTKLMMTPKRLNQTLGLGALPCTWSTHTLRDMLAIGIEVAEPGLQRQTASGIDRVEAQLLGEMDAHPLAVCHGPTQLRTSTMLSSGLMTSKWL